ncbi:MAG: hypothetical protein ACOZJX_12885 [Pseudomonadota bacterium]
MIHWAIKLTMRAMACGAVGLAAWWWLESVALALLFMAPALGVAFAHPLIEAVAALSGRAHEQIWRDVAGRHHAFQGQAVDVWTDDEGHAWLALAGVRRIVPGLPPDGHLARLAGERWQAAAPGRLARLRADALTELLHRATDVRTLKFRRWLERDVMLPARRRAERGR